MFFKAAKVENETDLQTLANRLSQVTAALSPKELGVSELKPIIEGWICRADVLYVHALVGRLGNYDLKLLSVSPAAHSIRVVVYSPDFLEKVSIVVQDLNGRLAVNLAADIHGNDSVVIRLVHSIEKKAIGNDVDVSPGFRRRGQIGIGVSELVPEILQAVIPIARVSHAAIAVL